jgi:hypothetical protein
MAANAGRILKALRGEAQDPGQAAQAKAASSGP